MEITDAKIQLIREDPRHFAIVYQCYVNEIYSYTYYLSNNRHKAEDLTSETFIKALEKFHLFKGEAKKLRGWLYAIARNIFIDSYRKNKKAAILADYDLEDEEANFSVTEENKIILEKVIKIINVIEPPIYAEILLLRYKQELDIIEISAILGKSEQNVRTLLHRALSKLKTECEMNNII